MPTACQVSHDERELFAASPPYGSGRCQGYGVDSRRTNTARPTFGKRQGEVGMWGHESPL